MTEQEPTRFERPEYSFSVEGRGIFSVRYRMHADNLDIRFTPPGGTFVERTVRMSENSEEVYRAYSREAIGLGQYLSDPQVVRGFRSSYERFLEEYEASRQPKPAESDSPSEQSPTSTQI
ncbi:MAG: hypothetical protein HY361_02885 [Candidatus Aenigmarchaeota archaeon]|nr:hypothetical protein [Candidatus Aenigmarchaeota archaeon]